MEERANTLEAWARQYTHEEDLPSIQYPRVPRPPPILFLSALVASDPKYLEPHNMTQNDIAGAILMGCRLNNVVHVTNEPVRDHEMISVPPDRVEDYVRRSPVYREF